jgi:L-erythrulose 1-phosphate isomerase
VSAPLWIGTGWKMTKTLAESRDYASRLVAGLRDVDLSGTVPFLLPPFTALDTVRSHLAAEPRVRIGAQNAHWEDDGAWTGEISVPQAADAGATIVEIGHSERREHFGETIGTTRRKVAATLRHGLTPLLCIGEPATVRDAGGSVDHILEQAAGALDGLPPEQLARVLVAYEPVWAIGETGRPAEVDEVSGAFESLQRELGSGLAGLLYGGSVTLDNATSYLRIPEVTGLFVGRTAWDVDRFLALVAMVATRQRTRTAV